MPKLLAFATAAALSLAAVTLFSGTSFAADMPVTVAPVQRVQPQPQPVAPAAPVQAQQYSYYPANTVLYGTANSARGYYWRPADTGWYAYNDRAWLSTTVVGSATGPSFTAPPNPPVPPYVVSPQPAPPPVVQRPVPVAAAAPTYPAPPGAPVTRGGLQPGTQAWLDYCKAEYQSFNPQTGKYLGYDENYHFCQ
ncbi:BA14K family protein [Amorphus orientalis]|uniref:Lectin-like protein BA14k n=1 Tax=Amorphus orientalis TaxID=649198 RepID=A0AAE3VMT9_9HYPH|nr:BA14K family protein [Amorphus orientalis]MDQ0314635.1 hypothetical protein [Amorphus orientalis]